MSDQWPGDYWSRQSGTGGYGPPPNGPWAAGPSGGQGPFGPQDPYGQDPYGQDPYGGYPQSPPAKGSTIAALIVAIISIILCCGFPTNVIGIVFAAMAMGSDRNPEDLERYTRYAWISNIVHIVIIVLVVIGYFALIVSAID